MSIPRRRFIERTVIGAGTVLLPRGVFGLGVPRQQALRILVLGGTGFIGPHIVRSAMERGHTVTIFNRGRTNTHLFPSAERLIGDRNGDISALEGKTWDVVIDDTGYTPTAVGRTVDLLADNVRHYIFTSTVDAYRDFRVAGMTEDYPLATLPEGAPEDPRRFYGPLKAECERVVVDRFPGDTTRVRPGWVAGPGDNNHLFTYWVMRVHRGGEVLSPGEPTDPMQITDVRDLGRWFVHLAEQRITGAYHAVGPVMDMGTMLEGIRTAVGSDARFTFVDADFLLERDVRAWTHIPIWWPPRNDWGVPSYGGIVGGVGALALDGRAAWERGLTRTPLAETARDTFEWYRSSYEGWPEDQRPGLTAGREAELLREWRTRSGNL